jgi:hypothetical protein
MPQRAEQVQRGCRCNPSRSAARARLGKCLPALMYSFILSTIASYSSRVVLLTGWGREADRGHRRERFAAVSRPAVAPAFDHGQNLLFGPFIGRFKRSACSSVWTLATMDSRRVRWSNTSTVSVIMKTMSGRPSSSFLAVGQRRLKEANHVVGQVADRAAVKHRQRLRFERTVMASSAPRSSVSGSRHGGEAALLPRSSISISLPRAVKMMRGELPSSE